MSCACRASYQYSERRPSVLLKQWQTWTFCMSFSIGPLVENDQASIPGTRPFESLKNETGHRYLSRVTTLQQRLTIVALVVIARPTTPTSSHFSWGRGRIQTKYSASTPFFRSTFSLGFDIVLRQRHYPQWRRRIVWQRSWYDELPS